MYTQLKPNQIHDLKHLHLIEKFNLKALDESVGYHINNPELIQQRNVVRRLQEKIIQAESYDMFLDCYQPVCKFSVSEYCDKTLKYTYLEWCAYGNCCRECTKYINRQTAKLHESKTQVIRSEFMKLMEELELADIAEEDRLY